MEKKYEPTRTGRFYPGAFTKPERAGQVLGMTLNIEELTVDDVIFTLSNIVEMYYHSMLQIVHDKWGAEAAKEVAYEFGLWAGNAFYQSQLTRWGTTSLDPEKMCMYQDLAHAMLGSSTVHTKSNYDDEKCEVRRPSCFLYSPNASEDVRNLCIESDRGFLDAYMKLDPKLEATRPKALPAGDDHCHHIFKYKK